MNANIIALREQCIKTVMGLTEEASVTDVTKLIADLTLAGSMARADLMRMSHVDKPLNMRKNP